MPVEYQLLYECATWKLPDKLIVIGRRHRPRHASHTIRRSNWLYVCAGLSWGDIFVWEVLASPHSRFSRQTGRTAQLKLPLRTQSSKCSHPLSFSRSLFYASGTHSSSSPFSFAPNAPVPSLARPEFSFRRKVWEPAHSVWLPEFGIILRHINWMLSNFLCHHV